MKAIGENNRDNVEKCFRDMLSKWFEGYSNCYLDTFVEALHKDTVGKGNLVEEVVEAIVKIEQQHQHGTKRPAGNNLVESRTCVTSY